MSLTSLFASIRGPVLIPGIRITKPSDPPASPSSALAPGGIRRWRGALGVMGDTTLQVPSQGPTRGARLALARQGRATGSFKLNCSESLHVVDEAGRAMFQRIELEEELEAARLGLMEKPPARGPENAKPPAVSCPATLPMASTPKFKSTRRMASYQGNLRSKSLIRQRHKVAALSQTMRFNESGLSSCATFSEGLCNFDDYMDVDPIPVTISDARDEESKLPTSLSAHDLKVLISSSTGDLEDLSLTWFDSLKKTSRNLALGSVGKKSSPRSLSKSLSCWDLGSTFSDQEGNTSIESPLASPVAKRRKVNKRPSYDKPKAKPLADISNSALISIPPKHLSRDTSWSKLRRKFSNNDVTSLTSTSLYDEETRYGAPLKGSISVATGIYFITQQGVSMTQCSGFEWEETLS